MGKCQTASSLVIVLFSAFVALGPSDAHAQAWVGDKGSLDLGLDYNFAKSDKVVADGDAPDFEDAGTTTNQFTVSGEYVPMRNLAVSLQIPIVLLKYNGGLGLYPHEPTGGSYDDGELHTTLTDLRFGARYQVLDEPLAIAPHIAASIPMADYETIGNTVAGRHLKMLHLGISFGYLIGDKTYTHLLYEFTLAEKYDANADTEAYSQNRSDLAFTIGRKFLDYKLDLHADMNMRRAHDGMNFSEFPDVSADVQDYHDAVLRENVLLVGAGVGYQLSNSLAVNLSGRIFVTGENTQNASVLALGVAWSPIQ